MLRRFVSILFVLALGIGVSQAAGGLSITSFGFIEGDCTYVAISITVIDFTYSDAAIDVQIYKNGSLIDSAQLSAYPSGSVSQGFVVDAVSGDSITATASIASAFATNAGPIVCGGSGGGSAGGGGAGAGATDGRLNYAADEYYTLYCAFDQLEIWRGVPSGLMLHSVPLADLLALPVGGGYDAGGGTTVMHETSDIFTVYGSTGNLAPQSGFKSFSMAACIAANGGEPQAAPPAVSPVQPAEVPDFCSTEEGQQSERCYPSEIAWCRATNFAAESCARYDVFRFFQWVIDQVFQCWMAAALGGLGLVAVVPSQLRLRRQRRDQPPML